MSLLDRRVLFVTGKGGVGKTTVTGALGIAAAATGRRVIAVEVGTQDQLGQIFDEQPAAGGETPLYPGLTGLSIDPQRALEEYLVLTIRIRAIAERLADSRALGYVAAAAPGLREMVTLGKIQHLTEERLRDGSPRYDLVIVDAPATGHGVGLLKTPQQFAEIARVGRISNESRRIATLIADRSRTGIVLVTLPEEMPVNETTDAVQRLAEIGLEADCVVVNALYPQLFTAVEEQAIRSATPSGETGRAAARAAVTQIVRRHEQEQETARLETEVRLPQVELPFLFRSEIDVHALQELADELVPALEAVP